MNLHRPIAALCASALVAGCAGATRNAAVLPGTHPASLATPKGVRPHNRAALSLHIHIPSRNRQERGKHSAFVSPGTQSMVATVNGGKPQIFNTVSGSPNCTSSLSGLSCAFVVYVPYGNDTIFVKTLSATDGTGSVLDRGGV